MNVKITFSDALYRYKHSLKISNRLVVICVFYRPESTQFLVIFITRNQKISHNAMRLRLESVHVHVG